MSSSVQYCSCSGQYFRLNFVFSRYLGILTRPNQARTAPAPAPITHLIFAKGQVNKHDHRRQTCLLSLLPERQDSLPPMLFRHSWKQDGKFVEPVRKTPSSSFKSRCVASCAVFLINLFLPVHLYRSSIHFKVSKYPRSVSSFSQPRIGGGTKHCDWGGIGRSSCRR